MRTSLYDLVRPPVGWRFDALVVCTYSADLRSVLALPAALLSDRPGGDLQPRAITPAQIAALRRICDRTVIFCQDGAVAGADGLPPAVIELEPLVNAVRLEGGGAFHPKVWLVRFRDDRGRVSLRLAVMSRNLTADRSWDAGVVLEGQPGRTPRDDGLTQLLDALPDMVRRPLRPAQAALVRDLVGQARTTRWIPPKGLARPDLRLICKDQTWLPPPSDSLVVFSPFLTKPALRQLRATRRLALVSRADALDRCWGEAVTAFDRRLVLDPPTGEDDARPGQLHAKIYAWDRGDRRGLAIGSMNATSAAFSGANVEFMAVFDATAALPDGVSSLLDTLAPVLVDHAPEETSTPEETTDDRPARRALSSLDLTLDCAPDGEGWRVSLRAPNPLSDADQAELIGLTFRPATLPLDQACPCLDGLAERQAAEFPTRLALAQITGFIVFASPTIAPFTLRLEVLGVSEDERRRAALQALIPDTRSFLEFVRALLGDDAALQALLNPGGPAAGWAAAAGGMGGGLLELLIRAVADDPQRLELLVEAFDGFGAQEFERLAPPEFRKLWTAVMAAREPA
ncbi:phospholipase D family protein [Brevundimonas sp. EAKA]|uniref:phospholipase D family protein n=1 Tax=Brevundimonas sp. EAKA TaxID=1495854 RepID=UPI0012DEE573|nr:phospholipase D family protein [Brevundimonas sp. EAKA]